MSGEFQPTDSRGKAFFPLYLLKKRKYDIYVWLMFLFVCTHAVKRELERPRVGDLAFSDFSSFLFPPFGAFVG